MRAVERAHETGQRIWFDDISRAMVDDGSLGHLRDYCGVSGVTANPTIFDKAISEADIYDEAIGSHGDRAATDPESVFWDLAVEDLQRAADLFLDRYENSGGLDGLVSLEVSPRLADDPEASIVEGSRLFARLDRPNVMIKIPGTSGGVPAIEELTARGVNVNVTLLFGLHQWEAVWEAYLRGLERRLSAGHSLDVTSVASFFLSRIDVKSNDKLDSDRRNRAALAVAQLVYNEWRRRQIEDPRWRELRAQGARRQCLLWASTSTKDPDLSATHYVERLLAPTVS